MMNPHRLLITGGTGFIGHHLIEHIMRGYTELDPKQTRICVLDRIDSTSSFERLRDIKTWDKWEDRVDVLWHDLRAPINGVVGEKIYRGLNGTPTAILHLAASTHVDRSIIDPMTFVQDNVVGTCNLLEYAKFLQSGSNPELMGGPTTLIFSTDEVYGNAPGISEYYEGDRHNPTNPYAATKAGAESLARAYRNTYDMDVLITNCMNVFGERQHTEKFIPMTIRKCRDGQPHIVHADEDGNPGTRFYLHARNCADATMFALLNGRRDLSNSPASGTYHIMGDLEVSNLEIVQWIHKMVYRMEGGILGLRYESVSQAAARPGHDMRYGLNTNKIIDMGFRTKLPFMAALEKTVRWYLDNPDWLEVT